LKEEASVVSAGENHPVPPGGDDILVATGVRKIYRTDAGAVEALRDVDLTVTRGDFTAIMGPSGCGKTTMLNCLSGLDSIDEGTVLVEGHDLHAMPDAKRSKHRAENMGFVFQAFNLIPVFTAAENVELPSLLAGLPPTEARRRAEQTLERVALGARMNHRPNELSGGEQQRVTIARALAAEPAIVWADEPTGNLDSETAWSIMELFRELNSDGLTLVLVTHDVAIGRTARRIVQMRDGRIESETASTPVAEPVLE
jgi:putative ABC transport system ATP-binding protein